MNDLAVGGCRSWAGGTETVDYLGVDRAMAAVRKEAARREWIDA
jgi:hypothetical protein